MATRRIREFLDGSGVQYVTMSHSPADSAQEIAASTHIPGRLMAKTVIVNKDGQLAMAVVAASRDVNLLALQQQSNALERHTGHRSGLHRSLHGLPVGNRSTVWKPVRSRNIHRPRPRPAGSNCLCGWDSPACDCDEHGRLSPPGKTDAGADCRCPGAPDSQRDTFHIDVEIAMIHRHPTLGQLEQALRSSVCTHCPFRSACIAGEGLHRACEATCPLFVHLPALTDAPGGWIPWSAAMKRSSAMRCTASSRKLMKPSENLCGDLIAGPRRFLPSS